MYNSITLKQCADLIAAVGDKQTVLVQGEMGIGKSAILKMLKDSIAYPQFKDAFFCYVDITTKDVGDFVVPKIKDIDGNEVCSFIPNEEFGFHFKGRKVVMMLDEVGKGRGGVMNACLRLMNERALGVYELTEGSAVFGTTNLSVEGLGDNVPPHALNRLTRVKVCKTNAATWIEDYAIPKGINPVIIGTVAEYPEMFASFEDYEKPEQNTYINDPRTVRGAVVTHRSMERAAYVYERTRILGDDVMCHALAGTVGEKAMHNILTMDKMDNQLTPWDDLIKSPETAIVPTSAAASCMLVSKAVHRIDNSNIVAWMKFLNRIPKEAQGLFARSVMSDKCPKRDVAARNTEFALWAAANNFLFAKK
jgi:hypothetical protein